MDIIEGLIPRGITMITGNKEDYKSLLALDIAIQVSAGTDKVLGEYKANSGNVLYLTFHNHSFLFDGEKECICNSLGIDIPANLFGGIAKVLPPGEFRKDASFLRDKLIPKIQERRYDLVVIDSLDHLIYESVAVTEAFAELKSFFDRLQGTSLVFVDRDDWNTKHYFTQEYKQYLKTTITIDKQKGSKKVYLGVSKGFVGTDKLLEFNSKTQRIYIQGSLHSIPKYRIPGLSDNISSQYVYVIRAGDTKHYKIGIAKDIGKRMSQLQTGNPYPLQLISYYEAHNTNIAFELEKVLHSRFKDNRAMGEWFTFTDTEIAIALGDINTITSNV